jgi:hypothetical protein
MLKTWLLSALCTISCAVALAGNTTYVYTGSPFTICDSCPINYVQDYLYASVTFSSPLPANQATTNELKAANLVSWTVGDILQTFLYSSSDANAAGEITELQLSTNASGAISGYYIDTLVPSGGLISAAGATLSNLNGFNLWTAGTNTPGQWWIFQGGSVTYNVSQTGIGFDNGAVTGIIQTDGTIGTLTAANILNWNLVVYNGTSATYGLTGGAAGNSAISINGSGLTATAGGIYYNYAATGDVLIQNGNAGWELGLPSGGQNYEALLPLGLNGNAVGKTGTQLLGGQQAILTYFTPNAFFDGQELSSVTNWDFLQFPGGSTPFGYYSFAQGSASTANAWLFHANLGYEYVIPGSAPGSEYFYDLASKHWWFTSSSLFPYLYDFSLNSWLFYFTNPQSPGQYSANPRYFSNLTTQTIFSM